MTHQILPATYKRLLLNISYIYEKARGDAVRIVRKILVKSYWEIGKRIVQVEQKDQLRAEYGSELLERLSRDLTSKYGSGFSITNLRYMRQFYLAYPIQQTSAKLSWSHFTALLSVNEREERLALQKKAVQHKWSVRELEEAIARIKKSQREFLFNELETKTPQKKLHVTRGVLNIYKVIQPKRIHPHEKTVVLDLGFNIWHETSVKGITRPKHDDVLEVQRLKRGFKFRRLRANAKRLFTYVGYVERVIDGDSIIAHIDCGFNVWARQRLRLRGIDTWEHHTPKGKEARFFVRTNLKDVPFVIVKTHGPDKYGRYLADIFYLPGADSPEEVLHEGIFLNQELLDAGLAEVMA